jgi:uncharacterized membrane protein YgcG
MLVRRLALALALILGLAAPAAAEERILSLVSDIAVQRDGSMAVAETIRVRAEGDRIQRGIFRDFPTRYRNRSGREVRVDFDVAGVERNGAAEDYATENLSNGVRVRIGNADRMLPPGEHEYRIRYRTTRQLGYFDTYDELYWNVTGSGWEFPIDLAEARIALPSPAQFGQRAFYTGPEGATGTDATVVSEEPGRIVFRTTYPLKPREGFTVAVAWPKGVVEAPNDETRAKWWLADNGPFVLGVTGLLGLLFYYFYAWKRAGRGPDEGTIVPLFSPEDDLTPAAMRFVSRMGFDNRAFAAAVVDLGVRGRVRLVEGEKGFFTRAKTTLEKTGDYEGLPAPEAAMMRKLFENGDSVLMDNKNHATFGGARTALSNGLKSAYEGRMFNQNAGWSLLGLLLIVGAMWLPATLIAATSGYGHNLMPSLGGLALAGFAIWLWIAAPPIGTAKWVLKGVAILCGVFAAILAIATIGIAFETGRVVPILIPLLIIPVAMSAFWWMAAPTKAGRAVMDRIAGFKRYLSVTEEERLETLHPPEKTPALFERYLPHAIALGVENQWAQRFSGVLAAAAATGQAHTYGWYSGHSDPWNDAGGFADSVGDSLASTISSASTAPGSSSGSGGGGSSGGGGGGGGGGGW